MKIGELAERLGSTERTLRFYEEQGLVHPARSAKGTRRYSEADAQRLEAVLTLARLDFPLEQIKALAETRRQSTSGDQASHRVHAQLGEMHAALQGQLRLMRRIERDLARAQEQVAGCFGCSRAPTLAHCGPCPTSQGLLEGTVMKVVWDEAPPREGERP